MKRQSPTVFGKAFYFFGTMCRQAIPDNDDVSPDVEFELAEEINASGTIEIFVGMEPEVLPAAREVPFSAVLSSFFLVVGRRICSPHDFLG